MKLTRQKIKLNYYTARFFPLCQTQRHIQRSLCTLTLYVLNIRYDDIANNSSIEVKEERNK